MNETHRKCNSKSKIKQRAGIFEMATTEHFELNRKFTYDATFFNGSMRNE